MAKHGTRYGYQEGCRCSECVEANAIYIRRRRAGEIPKREPKIPVVKVFSGKTLSTKIVVGEKRQRMVSMMDGSPMLAGLMLGAIGVTGGDTVEVEYFVDHVVVRKLS